LLCKPPDCSHGLVRLSLPVDLRVDDILTRMVFPKLSFVLNTIRLLAPSVGVLNDTHDARIIGVVTILRHKLIYEVFAYCCHSLFLSEDKKKARLVHRASSLVKTDAKPC